MRWERLDRRVRFERPVADDAPDGAGSGTWSLVAEVPASVQDALPSRAERLADGMNSSIRPARVRVHYRTGLDASMRILIGRWVENDDGDAVWETERVTQIVSGPAELGRRRRLEFVVEEYRPAGNYA